MLSENSKHKVRVPSDHPTIFKPWMWGDGVYGPNTSDINDDVFDWCNHHAGWGEWSEYQEIDSSITGVMTPGRRSHVFIFKEVSIAVLFKLTWV